MNQVKEIDDAIAAHGLWKTRLKNAIATGKTEIPLPTIRSNDQCAFGKWLHGQTLSAGDKTSEHYKTVANLHAKFHQAAAKIAELAVAGKKADAEKQLSSEGEFAKISGELTMAMLAWKKSQTPAPVR